jgi:cell division protein FtsX
MRLIHNLQQKTPAQRVLYTTIATVLVVVTLLGIWGYNFIHSTNISNIAGGAESVVSSVSSISISQDIDNALEQITGIRELIFVESQQSAEVEQREHGGAASEYQVIFNNSEQELNYGDNSADVLY